MSTHKNGLFFQRGNLHPLITCPTIRILNGNQLAKEFLALGMMFALYHYI
jgi:hypothetical protein